MIQSILAPVLVNAGAGILATVVRNKLGDGPARVIERVAGALKVQPTEEAIAERYAADPETCAAAIRAVEKASAGEFAELLRTHADMLAETHATMRAEASSGSLSQRIWRPGFAFVWTGCVAAIVGTICALLLKGDVVGLRALADLSIILLPLLAGGFGVLGVYAHGRTSEKVAGVR